MGDLPDMGAITGKLGTRWELARNTYKPYPAGIVMHAVIDAACSCAPRACAPTRSPRHRARRPAAAGARRPRGRQRARRKVSNQHCVAAALLRGAAGVAEFAAGFVADRPPQRCARR